MVVNGRIVDNLWVTAGGAGHRLTSIVNINICFQMLIVYYRTMLF